MNVPKFEDLNSSTAKSSYISKHFPEFYEYLNTQYPIDLLFNEKLFWYYNSINTYPICKICGSRTKFVNSKVGYREYCCYDCMNKSKDIQQKKKQTKLERYGDENYNNIEKNKQTCIERYGVDNVRKSEVIKKRIRETNKIRYGVEAPMQSEEIKAKSKATLLEKYGVEHNSNIDFVKQIKSDKKEETIKKMRTTSLAQFLKTHPNILEVKDCNYVCKCTRPNCNKCQEKIFTIPSSIYHSRRAQSIELCTIIKPIDNHWKNSNPELYIKDLLTELNIEFKENTRKEIEKEIDAYIPSHNLGIEVNGVYWHDSIHKLKTYHRDKYLKCKQQNIQLLSIWDDWIIHKRDIVRSIICSKLGIFDTRIYARKCDIREVIVKDSNHFLEQNHIQGKCSSSIRLGLYYNDELVSLMTFGRRRRAIMGNKTENEEEYELLRFCSKLNTQIIGGASKLLKYFIELYHPKTVVSFSSNDISDGRLYQTLGFEKVKENNSYWYIDRHSGKRYHRSSFTKDAIVRRGWKDTKEGWTEHDVMIEKGYYCIHDTGQTKWLLKVDKEH